MKHALSNRRYYFQHAQDEIAVRNIRRIFQCSLICLCLAVFLFVVTPFAYPNWKITAPYYLLTVFLIITLVMSCYFKKKNREQANYKWVTTIVIMFYMVLELFLIHIDVVENPNSEAIYFPFVLVVVPILFILPASVTFVINVILELSFVYVAWRVRSTQLVINDFYTSFFALVLSVIVANLVLNLRCEDNVAKFRYKRLSSIDSLTGTLNKATCTALTAEYIRERKQDEEFALFVLDVDNFKTVNDTLGHQAGDVILQKVGHILLDSFRIEDIVGRVGGDEFMILIKNVSDYSLVETRCTTVNEQLRMIKTGNSGMEISCSIGAVLIRNNHISYERCFSIADDALYEAKSLGRDRFVLREEVEREDYQKPILIVADDDEVNRTVIAETFHDDYEVIQARDGSETVDLINRYYSSTSVLLLDISMPKMDGYQVIRYMKERPKYKSIPVIVVSGYTENEEQALALGIEDVIVKPFNPDVAKLRVANAVKLRSMHE